MAAVAQTARSLRERMGRARVGRREREELDIFIEEGRRKRRPGEVNGRRRVLDGCH
jgi:hypothetical protein